MSYEHLTADKLVTVRPHGLRHYQFHEMHTFSLFDIFLFVSVLIPTFEFKQECIFYEKRMNYTGKKNYDFFRAWAST
jgi:hypothetical protein